MSKRDEFPKRIKDILAKRVAYICSRPGCDTLTIGPDHNGGVNSKSGTAAHITSAAPGPGSIRYDATLSTEQRTSLENGIWLCSTCANIIDADENYFTVSMLKQWKIDAERRTFNLLLKNTNSEIQPTTSQWNMLSNSIANFVQEHLFSVHRGAVAYDENVTALFGNDSYVGDDTRARNEVDKLRDYLRTNSKNELGFGISDDGYSWCLVIEDNQVDYFNDLIWTYWPTQGGYTIVQKKESTKILDNFATSFLNNNLKFTPSIPPTGARLA